VLAKGERPHPRRSYGRGGSLHDAADDSAIGENVVIWRHARYQSLPLRLKNLRRAELLVTLWRGLDRRDAQAAGNGDESR
jgi:hypothetical protein